MAWKGAMTRSIVLLSLLPLILASCDGRDAGSNPDSATNNASLSGLEQAALDSGVIANVSEISPTGLYRKRHEAGRDSLCIVTNKDKKLDFALEASFGEGINCRGHGTLRAAGDRLIMNFARSACIVVAGYEGDRVTMPGALDVECESLCSQRGSLEGVIFPRVSRDENVARAARGRKGDRLCS